MTDHYTTAEKTLLAPYDLTPGRLATVFGEIFGHRVDYADLYFQYARSEAWSLEEGIVKSGSYNIDQGVGVRAVSGEKTAFAYSDEISLPALRDAARATRAIAAAGATGTLSPLARRPVTALYAPGDPISSLADVDKVKLLERLERFARQLDPRVAEVMAHVAGTWEVVLVARSDGGMAADVRPLVRVSITVIMSANGKREQGHAGGGGRYDYRYFTECAEPVQFFLPVGRHLPPLPSVPLPSASARSPSLAGVPGPLIATRQSPVAPRHPPALNRPMCSQAHPARAQTSLSSPGVAPDVGPNPHHWVSSLPFPSPLSTPVRLFLHRFSAISPRSLLKSRITSLFSGLHAHHFQLHPPSPGAIQTDVSIQAAFLN
jgi:hypothetical protein